MGAGGAYNSSYGLFQNYQQSLYTPIFGSRMVSTWAGIF